MNIVLNGIVDKKVYPVVIKNNTTSYLTLYYYTSNNDALLHNDSHLICFESYEEAKSFSACQSLTIEDEIRTFDFDSPVLSYTDALNNWILLNTISHVLKMYFEGNDKKYDSVYDLLFRHSTTSELSSKPIVYDKKTNLRLAKVFKRKNRLLSKFIYYTSQS